MSVAEINNGSVKATLKKTGTTGSSKLSNLLALEKAINSLEEIDRRLAAARRKAENRKEQELIVTRNPAEELVFVRLDEEKARVKHISKNDVKKAPNGTELRWQTESHKVSTNSRKDRNGVTGKESHLRSSKELCLGQINSKSLLASH